MKYTTEYIVNLITGEPFVFDVDKSKWQHFERQKDWIKSHIPGQGVPPMYNLPELKKCFECSLFPAYEEVLKIFIEDGYTEELITQILNDFGLWPELTASIVANPDYRKRVHGWFHGVTCDGERARRTLKIAYYAVIDFLPKSTNGVVPVYELPA